MSDSSFKISCAVCRVILDPISNIIYDGVENVPASGRCLMVANHISHFDPPILCMHIDRAVDYMATEELFRPPIGHIVMPWTNAFPVRRDQADRQAVRTALGRLKQEKLVGIFPERGIRHGRESILHSDSMPIGGTALAQMAKAPVMPAIIIGSDQIYQYRWIERRPRVFVCYGKPMEQGRGEEREEFNARIHAAIKDLFSKTVAKHNIQEIELPHSAQERWAQEEVVR